MSTDSRPYRPWPTGEVGLHPGPADCQSAPQPIANRRYYDDAQFGIYGCRVGYQSK